MDRVQKFHEIKTEKRYKPVIDWPIAFFLMETPELLDPVLFSLYRKWYNDVEDALLVSF